MSSQAHLNDYQLGDSLGKGAFGQVYRALKWATGETVAIKEIELSNIPKGELGEIMSEIELLEHLNHPNIVKYKGYLKSPSHLYIILEFCENGSLHAISKRFGKFPETLVAVYISQVLEGLVYLHEQGVIHRDIKGANILTNKDGTVKLADFGVASNVAVTSNSAVVGSPYWMAPEVIEQSGATTASDIWSVGCVVIELLEGRPPYSNLSPMPALWRIVQDDHPPLPESASSIVKDFLLHCFQKDSNLRISAKKLLRHPWMVSARKQFDPQDGNISQASGSNAANTSTATAATRPRNVSYHSQDPNSARRPLSNYNFDEAVLKVQEWNEALRSPSRPSKHPSSASAVARQAMLRNERPPSPTPPVPPLPTSISSDYIGNNLRTRASASASPNAIPSVSASPSSWRPPPPPGTAAAAANTASTSAGKAGPNLNLVDKIAVAAVPAFHQSAAPSFASAAFGNAHGGGPSARSLQMAKEEQGEDDDNWDDDFEIAEGAQLGLSKVAGAQNNANTTENLTTTTSSSGEDNTRTIRAASNPSPNQTPRGKSKEREKRDREKPPPLPITKEEKGSGEDDDDFDDLGDFEEKVVNFKMRNASGGSATGSARRGLFHPDDIKTHLGQQQTVRTRPASASPKSGAAPLPSEPAKRQPPHTVSQRGSTGATHRPKRPSLSPLIPTSPLSPSPVSSTLRSSSPMSGGMHSRSSSFVNNAASSSSSGGGAPVTPFSAASMSRASSHGGSMGRAELRRINSQAEFGKYAELDEDEDDYEDVFFDKDSDKNDGTPPMQTLQLNTRLSNRSWLGDDDDQEDPFAEIEDDLVEDDLETNLQRDKYARLCATVNGLIDELTPAAPDFQLKEACDSLLTIISESPEMVPQLVSSHGMLAILEVLEGKCGREVILRLLTMVNMLVTADPGFLESFCLIGGIPVMMGFTSKKYPSDCRLEASEFIKLLCHTSVLTLQMFISCRGLKVLVDLLDEDLTEQESLVVHALNGIGSVFELQSPTTKNDFCRMFIREGLLDPLSAALLNVMTFRSGDAYGARSRERRRSGSDASFSSGSRDDDPTVQPGGEGSGEMISIMKMKIIQILLVFCHGSQSDVHIRNALGTRKVVRRLLRACELLEPEFLVQMLKAVKQLSMNATLLEVLQNANALEILIRILDEQSSGPHSTEMANHIFQTCYNLCRLNKSRQEESAQAGIIPCLQRVIETASPLKQFALPILCDLASAGKSCRTLLWMHDGLGMYLKLLDDPYFQVSALESIVCWLQDETARIEDELMQPPAIDSLLRCFNTSKANSFENLLDPFLKLTRLSPQLTNAIARSPALFRRIVDRLSHNSKPIVRLNLLKILRAVCEHHPNRTTLVERYGLLQVVEGLSRNDGAVLVKELAREIMPVLRPSLKPAGSSSSSAHTVTSVGVAGAANGKPKLTRKERPDGVTSPTTPKTPRSAIAPKKTRIRRTASESSGVTLSSLGHGTHQQQPSAGSESTGSRSSMDSVSRLGGTASRVSSVAGAAGESSTARLMQMKAKSSSRAKLDDIAWSRPGAGVGPSSKKP